MVILKNQYYHMPCRMTIPTATTTTCTIVVIITIVTESKAGLLDKF